uniref:(northern house mosquito) hypothetical protein n=1 Tax=Culex pipiens TaxID=7175 RepID=A0A8D8HB24_CULPI
MLSAARQCWMGGLPRGLRCVLSRFRSTIDVACGVAGWIHRNRNTCVVRSAGPRCFICPALITHAVGTQSAGGSLSRHVHSFRSTAARRRATRRRTSAVRLAGRRCSVRPAVPHVRVGADTEASSKAFC